MNNFKAIEELMIELKDASLSGQWTRLQDVDRRIAAQLVDIQSEGNITPELKVMLTRMAYIHRKCLTYCEKKSDELESKMTQHRHTREGMAAYENIAQ